MILLIDNYDSFTYNLYQLLSVLGASVDVVRNDELTLIEAREHTANGIVISPGPGAPSSAGVSCDILRDGPQHTPVLGVCLGHQCIGEVFGGRVVAAPELRHGKTSLIHHDGVGVFSGLPSPFQAVRYHSLAIDPHSLPPSLTVTARADDGTIMGLKHVERPVEGVQFHPESILTHEGPALVRNFLLACGEISEKTA